MSKKHPRSTHIAGRTAAPKAAGPAGQRSLDGLSGPDQILALQRAIGNQAVQRLLAEREPTALEPEYTGVSLGHQPAPLLQRTWWNPFTWRIFGGGAPAPAAGPGPAAAPPVAAAAPAAAPPVAAAAPAPGGPGPAGAPMVAAPAPMLAAPAPAPGLAAPAPAPGLAGPAAGPAAAAAGSGSDMIFPTLEELEKRRDDWRQANAKQARRDQAAAAAAAPAAARDADDEVLTPKEIRDIRAKAISNSLALSNHGRAAHGHRTELPDEVVNSQQDASIEEAIERTLNAARARKRRENNRNRKDAN